MKSLMKNEKKIMTDNGNHHSRHKWQKRLRNWFKPAPKTRSQLITLLREMAQHKTIDADALGMIEGVLQVSEMQVRDIMVPRAQMVVIEYDSSPAKFLPIVIQSQHSRFPVIGENRDEVLGIMLAKDLLRYSFNENEKFEIRDILRAVVFIPESKRLNVLLREFRANRNHMAIVVDEYGGAAGLVTIEDVLEQIVGEIEDEYDIEEEGNIKKLGNLQYTVKALTPVTDFNEYFDTNFSDEEFDTVGGLVLKNFGHLPKRGETVKIDKISFKVLHADNRRIRLLRVTLPKTKDVRE